MMPYQIENRVVPLYHQIQQLIRHRVAKNHYAPGSQIAFRTRAVP